ncbi:MAG: efflux RND transporter periplasmic adaptor subunit [Verrucomicrobia bacterium]|nr:efflux RND transporter periplasmic adaptor subunit [Verrucomicrobiota bacterium]
MTNKTIHRLMTTALILPLLAPFSGCKQKEQAPPAAPPEVEVVAIQQRDVPIYRDWVGTLEADVNATITAQVSGYLTNRAYTEGNDVTNGQVLFEIDQAPFQAALDQAKAQLAQAQAMQEKYELNVKKYRPLVLSQAISQQELDDAVQNEKTAAAQVEGAKAAVEQANLNLQFTKICSPVDGVAGLAKAQIGDLIGPSTGQLTTVAKIKPIRVYVSVSQQVITDALMKRLAQNKSPHITGEEPQLELILASGALYPLPGRILFKNNQVDVKTGTISVVGEFQNPQNVLAPGMFVRVKALLNTETNALVVPQRAVTDMQGRSLIAVVGEDKKVSIRPVTVGEPVGEGWVITGNVKAGDRVVAEGIQKVRDGAVVNPVPFGAKPAAATTPAAKEDPKKL